MKLVVTEPDGNTYTLNIAGAINAKRQAESHRRRGHKVCVITKQKDNRLEEWNNAS